MNPALGGYDGVDPSCSAPEATVMATSATHRGASSSTRLPATAPTFTELVSGVAETWAQHRGPLICSLAATVLATTGLLVLIVTGT